ncbi:hypothetical protein [Candidatus Villigracilis saccharophilus]|uniref:hypothetical protein n=1 Tax=Candidatus Villigracilis saccharophilus TaxID=3140684 RepID=UPI003136F502|nr:hypothetical protein [Anaerolineales bacterium]
MEKVVFLILQVVPVDVYIFETIDGSVLKEVSGAREPKYITPKAQNKTRITTIAGMMALVFSVLFKVTLSGWLFAAALICEIGDFLPSVAGTITPSLLLCSSSAFCSNSIFSLVKRFSSKLLSKRSWGLSIST